jgi:Spy/CpxP family protein refolding chaperone
MKFIILVAAGCFGAGSLLAGTQESGVVKVQNETKEFKMACSVPLGDLNLTAEQKQKMKTAMDEHHKTGCTGASEAKFMEQARATMTPEQYAKFKAEYDQKPAMQM